MSTTAGSAAPTAADPALEAFLEDQQLSALGSRLASTSLTTLTQTLFGEDGRLPPAKGRPALLKQLSALNLPLRERQALANALGRASREGFSGIAETEADIKARTAWIDAMLSGSTSAAEATSEPGAAGDEPPWARSARPFLVFTSAGDANHVPSWVHMRSGRARDWDLCVVYYGTADAPACLDVADHALRMRGGKFPNLVRAMRAQPHYFSGFEAILVADDDLAQLDGDALSGLFALRRAHDLWLLQPANHATLGKADFQELRARPGATLRLVNFIEVTAPLLRTDVLLRFVREYVPRRHEGELLVGYGIDSWLCQWLLGVDPKTGDAAHPDKAAVVDAIPFVNPMNDEKPHGREIDRLLDFNARVEAWQAVCKRRGLAENYPFRTFRTVAEGDGDLGCAPSAQSTSSGSVVEVS